MMGTLASKDLLRVLQVRRASAEVSITKQKVRVYEYRQRHLQQLLAVENLNNSILQATGYRESVQHDAVKTHAALSHRSHLEYELERESFYEGVAKEELDEEERLLKEKLQNYQKTKAKITKVDELIRRDKARADFIKQDLTEEDFQSRLQLGGAK